MMLDGTTLVTNCTLHLMSTSHSYVPEAHTHCTSFSWFRTIKMSVFAFFVSYQFYDHHLRWCDYITPPFFKSRPSCCSPKVVNSVFGLICFYSTWKTVSKSLQVPSDLGGKHDVVHDADTKLQSRWDLR